MNRSELALHLTNARLSEIDMAVAFVWFRAKCEDTQVTSASEIFEFFESEAISKPNRHRLRQRMLEDRRLMNSKAGFRVRLAASPEIESAVLAGNSQDVPSVTSPLIQALTTHAQAILDVHTRSFLLEAIDCMKCGSYRAAVIMSWCGAMAILQEYVFHTALSDFNRDAVANGVIKKQIKTLSDMRDLSKESHFIESLGRISILDSSMKRTLKRCLERRNDCGHPSDVKLGEAAVADQIESLILNVFSRFDLGSAKAA